MRLDVTLLTPSYGWMALLDQVGVPFVVNSDPTALKSTGPAIIINSVPAPAQRTSLLDYVKRGGVTISEADTAAKWPGIPTRKTRIRYLHAEAGPLFSGLPHLDFPFRAHVPSPATHLPDQNGVTSVAIVPAGKGLHIILPAGFAAAMADSGVRRVNFPRSGGERYPSERIARVSKGVLRHILQRLLTMAYHYRGLPFVTKWPFPTPAETVFGFRIDTDFAQPSEIDGLYNLLQKHRLPASWFVETRSAASWIGQFAAMSHQEIGLHCYRHIVAGSEAENLADITQGLDILKRANIRPDGYAAPFGEWHPSLARAVEKSGFRYASEFAQGYDALPFFPALGDVASTVLQMPIHPVSVGRLKWARHTPAQMTGYYLNVISARRALREPAFLYHHPGQGHLAVFDDVFRDVISAGIPLITMGDYARWWRRRKVISPEITWKNNCLSVGGVEDEGDFWLCVRFPDQPEKLFPLKNGMIEAQAVHVTLPATDWQPPHPEPLHHYSARMLIHDITWRYSRWKQKRN